MHRVFLIGPGRLNFFKVFHQYFEIHHDRNSKGFYFKVSQFLFYFLLGVPTLEDALYLIFQIISLKIERWPYPLVAIGHKLSSLNDINNETSLNLNLTQFIKIYWFKFKFNAI